MNDLPQTPLNPDLNPIEHMWDELGRAVRSRPNQPKSLRELGHALIEEWAAIP